MSSGIPLVIEQGPNLASGVDSLYFFITAVTAFFALLVVVFVIAFAVRDRTGKGMGKPIHGSIPLEIGWSVVPFLVTMVIFAWATAVLFDMV